MSSTEKSDAVTTLLIAKWLRDRVKEWEASAKAVLERHMLPGGREPAYLNEIDVGAVTYAKGRREVTITDDQEFARWVQQRWPTEVEVVVRVRDSFVSALKARALNQGALIDDEGEVCPYVEVGHGSPYFLPKPTDDAAILFAAALKRGDISEAGPKAIEGKQD